MGQSEIEIAGLADITIVVVVPEAGDEVQTMKAGLMEIADIFVVNKSDRPGADLFVRNLRLMLAPAFHNTALPIPVLKTTASKKQGIAELFEAITAHPLHLSAHPRRSWLLAEKAYYLLQQKRMKDIDKQDLKAVVEASGKNFNLYRFVESLVRQPR